MVVLSVSNIETTETLTIAIIDATIDTRTGVIIMIDPRTGVTIMTEARTGVTITETTNISAAMTPIAVDHCLVIETIKVVTGTLEAGRIAIVTEASDVTTVTDEFTPPHSPVLAMFPSLLLAAQGPGPLQTRPSMVVVGVAMYCLLLK